MSYTPERSESERLCRVCWEACISGRPGVRWTYPKSPTDLERRGSAQAHATSVLIVHVDCLDDLEETGDDRAAVAVAAELARGDRVEVSR